MSAVAEAVMDLPAAADDLRLGGANALAEFYIGHRLSVDLDFFAMEAGRIEAVSRELTDRLPAAGIVASVHAVRTGADFHRLSLQPPQGGDELVVDLGRWMPPQTNPPVWVDGIRVEAFSELAVGKFLALIDRGEPKDVLDLWAICRHGDVSLQALIDLVFVKDPGLEEAPFAIANRLSQIGRRLPQPLPPALELVDPEEIQRWFANEATAMWRRIRPEVDEPT
jgi:Nucleotidyl transferase AbiEii toxin, Type IV TA system